jgi:hypothetical protein
MLIKLKQDYTNIPITLYRQRTLPKVQQGNQQAEMLGINILFLPPYRLI